jgi:hypothetical protein
MQGSGRGQIKVLSRNLRAITEEIHETSVGIARLLRAEIWNRDLKNTKQECQPFGPSLVTWCFVRRVCNPDFYVFFVFKLSCACTDPGRFPFGCFLSVTVAVCGNICTFARFRMRHKEKPRNVYRPTSKLLLEQWSLGAAKGWACSWDGRQGMHKEFW